MAPFPRLFRAFCALVIAVPLGAQAPAHGRIVAPGFIDSHTHDDLAVLRHRGMDFKVSQGVTTVVTGNCGISPAPLEAGTPTPAPISLAVSGGGERFGTFASYLQAMERSPALMAVFYPVPNETSEENERQTEMHRHLSAGLTDIPVPGILSCYPPARVNDHSLAYIERLGVPYSGFGFERIALSPRCRSNGCQQDRHRRPQEHSHFTWSSSGRIVWPHCLRRTGSHFAGQCSNATRP